MDKITVCAIALVLVLAICLKNLFGMAITNGNLLVISLVLNVVLFLVLIRRDLNRDQKQ